MIAGGHLIALRRRHYGRSQEPMIHLAALRKYLGHKSGVRGLAKARAALAMLREGVDSPPETRIRLILQRGGLPEFVPDFPIEGEAGDSPVWVDLGCAKYRVCVEYVGARHLTRGKTGQRPSSRPVDPGSRLDPGEGLRCRCDTRGPMGARADPRTRSGRSPASDPAEDGAGGIVRDGVRQCAGARSSRNCPR